MATAGAATRSRTGAWTFAGTGTCALTGTYAAFSRPPRCPMYALTLGRGGRRLPRRFRFWPLILVHLADIRRRRRRLIPYHDVIGRRWFHGRGRTTAPTATAAVPRPVHIVQDDLYRWMDQLMGFRQKPGDRNKDKDR